MRFLPNTINFSTVTNIYGNKVAIFSLEKEVIGVLIESTAIASTQRAVFGILWSISTP